MMVAKFNSKNTFTKYACCFYTPFHPRLTSKFAKSANMIRKNFNFQKCKMGIKKTQDLMLLLYLLIKMQKSQAKKLTGKK
jgi:hypothetical protein